MSILKHLRYFKKGLIKNPGKILKQKQQEKKGITQKLLDLKYKCTNAFDISILQSF